MESVVFLDVFLIIISHQYHPLDWWEKKNVNVYWREIELTKSLNFWIKSCWWYIISKWKDLLFCHLWHLIIYRRSELIRKGFQLFFIKPDEIMCFFSGLNLHSIQKCFDNFLNSEFGKKGKRKFFFVKSSFFWHSKVLNKLII